MSNPLSKRYGNDKRWVNWRFETVKGKQTKVPYGIDGKRASSTGEESWSTLKEAWKAVPGQVGIVFTPEQKLLGIDIDKCLNDEGDVEHEEGDRIRELIARADTYTEVSPSGTGLHLYFELEDALELTANRHGNFEAYTSGRYFTVTAKPYGKVKEVRVIDEMEAISLLSIIGYPWGREEKATANQAEISSKLAVVPAPALTSGEDATLWAHIFASRNGSEVEALHNGDLSRHKNDHSAADMSLLAHLAFWTGRDSVRMERMWMESPLGRREKTQTRPDYRSRSLAQAVTNCKKVYEAPVRTPEVEATPEAALAIATKLSKEEEELAKVDLLYTLSPKKDKIFTLNTENIIRVLEQHPEFAGRLRYDEFKNILEIKNREAWTQLKDHTAITIQTRISVLFPCFGKVGKEMVTDAVLEVSQRNKIDSAADYLTSLVWDCTPRLDSWLASTFKVPEDAYHQAAGSNWLKGLVKRVMMPGCKFDYVLVLEGEQGTKKSTSLAILGRDWHVETTMATDNKDFFMQFEGKAIVEFSEGETLSRTEVKRMKGIITTPVDKYRAAYARLSEDHPRRCVFAMTTNQTEYLKDETGNRRWLPVACQGVANVAWLSENRDQLYAEAYHRVITLKESTWEFPEEETKAAQDARRVSNPNADLIAHWYVNELKDIDRINGVTVQQAYKQALCGGYSSKPLDKYTEISISEIFKNVIKLKKERRMVEGVQANRWFSAAGTISMFADIPQTDLEKF